LVGPQKLVRDWQELLDQITVGAMDLDAVEPGSNALRAACRKAFHHARYLAGFERARRLVRRSFRQPSSLSDPQSAPPTARPAIRPAGWNEECETRPTCQSWRKITPPLA